MRQFVWLQCDRMPELRWILIVFGLALLIGIYVWGRRGAKSAAIADDVTPRPDPAFEPAASYDEFEAPLVPPIEEMEIDEPDAQRAPPERVERGWVARDVEASRPAPIDESRETTVEAYVPRERPRDLRPRIEPTFNEESVTAELPVREEPEPELAASPSPAKSSLTQPVNEAPTIGMSNTPPPRRIERRKIIALRLAAGGQRLNGLLLKNALDAEGLEHGKYDVFHRLDNSGASIFSIASMMEPGTFDLEKMPQETYPGITLFTQLPGPVAGMLAFNELIACSRRLHAALGGTLQDERGVPLTVHRIERLRQEIREFELRPASDPQRSSSTFTPTP
jgi:cell division protein ZipA